MFNADSDTVVGSVALTEFGTDDCSILDDQSLGFVNDFGPQQVWVIDPSVPSLAAGINPIPVSEASEDLTISADQQFLLNTGGFTDSRVSVIDIANRMEIHSFDVGNSAESVEACSDNSVLTSGVVGNVVNRLTIDGGGNLIDTGESLELALAFNVACGPSGGNAVVSQIFGGPNLAQSYTYPPLAAASSTILAGHGVTVVISPDGSRAYVRSTFTVEGFTYNEATGALGAAPFLSIPVAFSAVFPGVDQMAIHPNGTKLYVSEGAALNVYDAFTMGAPLAVITDAALTEGLGVCLPKGGVIDIDIDIDIKPGRFPNSINPRNRGVIPVAILSTPDFDATTVDPLSVEFGPNAAVEANSRGHIEDVDGDALLDLVVHFPTQETGIQCGDTEALLTGQTFDGTGIQGSDSVRTVGCKKNTAP